MQQVTQTQINPLVHLLFPPHTDQRRPTTTGKKQPLSTEQEANSEANLPAGSNCPGPWQQAKSKALAAFPGNRAIDSFDDLELTEKFCFESPIPFTIIPSEPDQLKVDSIVEGKTAGIVMVMKLVSPFFNPWRHHWIVEVSRMLNSLKTFSLPESRL